MGQQKPEIECLGYIKYKGKLVEEGFLDARKSAQALLGLDSALRFFSSYQRPRLSTVQYEIPVRIQKGCWEALIPAAIAKLFFGGVGIGASAYIVAAATKMAQKDFKDVGLKDVFRKSIESMQWVIKIGTHLGSMKQRSFKTVKFRKNNQEIGIYNSQGKLLYVPKEHLEAYSACNQKILSQLADVIEKERELAVGVIYDGVKKEEKITFHNKHIFATQEEEEEILFPELEHGQTVTLEGYTTRGNETYNDIGFKYQEHTLACRPVEGNIAQYKRCLFLKCRISGEISRLDKKGKVTETRPKIIFTYLEPIEGGQNLNLF